MKLTTVCDCCRANCKLHQNKNHENGLKKAGKNLSLYENFFFVSSPLNVKLDHKKLYTIKLIILTKENSNFFSKLLTGCWVISES